jgi:peptide-methionine (R)-S-oxide reductase
MTDKIHIDEEELRHRLTPEQYQILREKGTEAPGSSPLLHEKGPGMFACAVCGQQLFSSDAKFDTTVPGLQGWPSFDQALPGSIELKPDHSYGMSRTEVVCSQCGSHLGHLFDDPEAKSGKHYCINGACLLLKKA